MAARFLKNKGYLILETNYRCRWGEIDIVALEEGQMVFVEVRTRKGQCVRHTGGVHHPCQKTAVDGHGSELSKRTRPGGTGLAC